MSLIGRLGTVDSIPDGVLNARIDALRVGFAGHRQTVLARNRAYLRAFSPKFETKIGEHDQWSDPFTQQAADHYRSSYNVTRAVVELWTALEMSEFPAIRWQEGYIPVPVPSLDPVENEARQQTYASQKLVSRTITTMREQALLRHVRSTNLGFHSYRAVRRKNVYGNSWMKTVPDTDRRTFRVFTRIDPSTVYPVYSSFDDEQLDAVLCATRRSAQKVNEEFPGTLDMSPDGLTLNYDSAYYQPVGEAVDDADRAWVWVEDYWYVDATWTSEPGDDGVAIRSRVVNVIRANGKIVQVATYPGWRNVPYVQWQNENERDQLGFSDVGTMLPIQDTINRFLSQQQDVIAGESRPKFKYRGDAERQIVFDDESIVSLDQDEDIEQIQVRLDVFPTQTHGQQILEFMSRATGLPDTVWGRITAAQNSGRALATAWRAVAARMVPRTMNNTVSARRCLSMWADWMELYEWDNAPELFQGNRDFELDFPNQEPRDFTEVSMEAINALNAGLIDHSKAMEIRGERSPDEMLDRVRRGYMDPILYPDKRQGQLLLEKLELELEIAAQQAGIQQQAAEAQLAELRGSPPGGAPGAATADQAAGAARQASVQAAQQAAPTRTEGQNQPLPATQAGQTANAGTTTKVGTLVQDGSTYNRIVTQSEI
jgi:hypothetical protein